MKGFFELFLLFTIVESHDRVFDGLPTNRPLIIAHRGSSGMRPENTVAAYQLAIQQGADIIECDVALTKDLVLVCTHNTALNSSTDVNLHPQFSTRVRTYLVDFANVTDYFTIDFTLAELKTLRKVQQNPLRDQSFNGMFQIATFDEYVAVAKNSSRVVGIYPEVKSPPFVNGVLKSRGHNTTFEDILLQSLTKHGYTASTSPCFIQSFYPSSLKYMAPKTSLPLVRLVFLTLSDTELADLATHAYGIGVRKDQIVRVANNKIVETTDYVKRIQAKGLKVHAWTFKNDELLWDYGADPYREYKKFVKIGVDGFFTDFPWSLSNYMTLTTGGSSKLRPSSYVLGLTLTFYFKIMA